MWQLPVWVNITELVLIILGFAWVCFLLFIIATSQLHTVCRALFCTNVIAVLTSGVGQIGILLWIISNGRPLGANEFFFFPLVFLHQIGYFMCAISFLLIIGERLLLCYEPGFYERRNVSFFASITAAMILELVVTIPVVIAMQYEKLSIVCASLIALQEAVSLVLLKICKDKSREYYETKFMKESLNSRFEVKGVIELTTATIPICASALAVKALLLILNFISYYSGQHLVHDAHFLLRVASLSYGILYPFLLIFRVKTLRRRFFTLFPASKTTMYGESRRMEETAESSTKKYFEHLSNQWN